MRQKGVNGIMFVDEQTDVTLILNKMTKIIQAAVGWVIKRCPSPKENYICKSPQGG